MGDIAVDIFQETLKELITSPKLSLIVKEKHQLESLEDEIKYLRGFLKDTEKKRNDHPEVMKLVMQIRDLVSEAENIVELFVLHAFWVEHASYSLREHQDHHVPRCDSFSSMYHLWSFNKMLLPFPKKKDHHASFSLREHQDHLSLDLKSVKKGMKTLTVKVKKIYDKNMYDINGATVTHLKHLPTRSGGISGSSKGSHTSEIVDEKMMVGFKEEVEKLLEKLDDGGQGTSLEIILLIGAGGSGKTTLAKKVYNHPFTLHTFDIRAWINVSQEYHKIKKRDLLICILESFSPGDYKNSSDDKLGEDILKRLKGRKYLIVMDDIWGIEAWNDIERSFPKECKGSKVLFTSRLLVQLDGVRHVPHYLAPLPTNMCWELLQKKVFGMERCPWELVYIGKQIAKKCKGLPLAVVTIAGILATQDKTLDVWEKVAEHLSSILVKDHAGCMEILELSYNHLPVHLKACFLYMGRYPEDYKIPMRELIWLWIAEGFIQQSEGVRGSLETIAEGYLIDLIDRSLVQVAMKGPLGVIKACHIHDLLRELCLKKAEDDNFLGKVYKVSKHGRHFISPQRFEKFSDTPRTLRSFMCFGLVERPLDTIEEKISFFVQRNELLRVLAIRNDIWRCWDREIGQLVHLRYLACKVSAIVRSSPNPISNLLNLQTLTILDGVTHELPPDIFKMVKLRHLYSKDGLFTFHHSSEEPGGNDFDRSSMLDSLQTLHRICACEACRSLLLRTPNLKKLGLHAGTMPKVMRIPDLDFLKCLEKLTLSGCLKSTLLPRLKLQLPQTIRRITLISTYLKWEELSLLQTLPSLEVLKLMMHACAGPIWNTSELDGFPQLKYLRFYILDIEEWIASEDQFPKLEVLTLEYCNKLEQIPKDFGNLNELRKINLYRCRPSVKESAREIQEGQRNRNGDDDCLNLFNTPPVSYDTSLPPPPPPLPNFIPAPLQRAASMPEISDPIIEEEEEEGEIENESHHSLKHRTSRSIGGGGGTRGGVNDENLPPPPSPPRTLPSPTRTPPMNKRTVPPPPPPESNGLGTWDFFFPEMENAGAEFSWS